MEKSAGKRKKPTGRRENKTGKGSSGNAARKALRKKIEELARYGHLPPEMTALVTAVSELQLDALEHARPAFAAPAVTPGTSSDTASVASPAKSDVSGAASTAPETPLAAPYTIPAAEPGKLSAAASALARAKAVSSERHAQGEPLLALRDFPVDMPLAEELAAALLRALAGHVPSLAEPTSALERQFASDASFFGRACRELLEEGEEHGQDVEACVFAEWAAAHPEAPDMLRFVVKSAVAPFVMAFAEVAGARHDAKTSWAHGHCPVCGSLPYMGRLEGSEGSRLHTCSFCFFEYRVPRIGCPFCLTQAHDGSEYLESEDEPGYLLDVCKKCRNYIKLADFRKLDRAWFAALDDLASLTLDLYARQMGYTRPTPSAWGF